MRIYSLFFLLLLFWMTFPGLHAQDIIKSLETNKSGQGTVAVHQDDRIGALIGTSRSSGGSNSVGATSEKKFLRTPGYRVQVYAGNNSRKAKEEASSRGAQVKEYFPELPIYTHFSSPRWLCRVGDFKSIEEADATMRKLKATGVFKEVSIVREQINIPL